MNIIVPYLAWTICSALTDAVISGSVNWNEVWRKTFVTNRMFWFLPTLYGLLAGYVCYCRIRNHIWNIRDWQGRNEKAETCICFVSCCLVTGVFVLLMIFTKHQLFRDITGFTIPFFAAVMYMELRWVYKLFYKRETAIAAFLVFILLIGKFDFDNACIATSVLRMILGMCAVVILFQLFRYMRMPEWVCGLFVVYGYNSLLIYILHSRVLGYSGLLKVQDSGVAGSLVWYCAVSVFICGVCSVFSKGLSYVPIARLLFLGKCRHLRKRPGCGHRYGTGMGL